MTTLHKASRSGRSLFTKLGAFFVILLGFFTLSLHRDSTEQSTLASLANFATPAHADFPDTSCGSGYSGGDHDFCGIADCAGGACSCGSGGDC